MSLELCATARVRVYAKDGALSVEAVDRGHGVGAPSVLIDG